MAAVVVVAGECRLILLVLAPWCASQCSRANACLCLFVQGLGFFGLGFVLLFNLTGQLLLILGLKNIARASLSRYFSASVAGLSGTVEAWLRWKVVVVVDLFFFTRVADTRALVRVTFVVLSD